MSALSNYGEQSVLTTLLGGTVYLGLALSTPFSESDTAPFTKEVSVGGYARITLAAGFTIADAGGGQWQATLTAAHGHPTATADYGTPPTDKVEGWGIFDAATNGNLVLHGVVGTPVPVYNGQLFYWPAGSLVIEAQ